MKWDEVKDQFFQAAQRLNDNVEYITKVGEAFEALVKVLYTQDPNTCIDKINSDAEIVGKIFSVEDPANIPPEAVNASSQALAKTQQFLFTFLRVAHLFNSMPTAQQPSAADFSIPPGAKFH